MSLALAILIGMGVCAVWDALDPYALKVKVESPARLVAAFALQVALVTLLLTLVHASAAAVVAIILGYVLLLVLHER